MAKITAISSHKFEHRNNAVIYAKTMSFGVILKTESSFIGLTFSFGVITPTPKFQSWRSHFCRVSSRTPSPKIFIPMAFLLNKKIFW